MWPAGVRRPLREAQLPQRALHIPSELRDALAAEKHRPLSIHHALYQWPDGGMDRNGPISSSLRLYIEVAALTSSEVHRRSKSLRHLLCVQTCSIAADLDGYALNSG